ncbi:kinesin [Ordospora pajunii]|uniref:kinesin n=1 Tax=Ordospora pajunii TaxID=3039483 RepID=UPI00295262E1|nr:kinesin [Ordospora pajunii]KAH9410569.1 kinesin [Ordospora pajunii]
MIKDLQVYLLENKIGHLYQFFERLGIDESQLLAKLKYSDLEKIGIENLIERRKVFDVINEINQDMYNDEVHEHNVSARDSLAYDVCVNQSGMCGIDAELSIAMRGIEKQYDNAEKFKSNNDCVQSTSDDCIEADATACTAESSSYLFENGHHEVLFGEGVSIEQKLFSCTFTEKERAIQHEKATDIEKEYSILSMADPCLILPDEIMMNTGMQKEKIVVCVRKKPCDITRSDIVEVDGQGITVNESRTRIDLTPYVEQHRFEFDYSFDSSITNIGLYRECVKSIVSHVVSGGFGTVIAYGQTGTGKTYTMLEKNAGMLYLAMKDLILKKQHGTITFCEIYMGQVYDLLDGSKKVHLREVNGVVHLSNSKEEDFNGYESAMNIIDRGIALRKTGVTGANSKSSRSHAVVLVNFFEGTGLQAADTANRNNSGSIVFVDLAGSERGSDRKDMTADVKNEGAEINKSLLALKECIRGMEKDKRHLPFRQSKLTQILKNSFIGMSRTCLIATISPSLDNVEHTLNTLRYAARIKEGTYQGSKVVQSPGKKATVHLKQPLLISPKPGCKSSADADKCMLQNQISNAKHQGIVSDIIKVLSQVDSNILAIEDLRQLEKILEVCKAIGNKQNA